MVSSLVEPFLGILGDVWKRNVLILGGGLVFALALLLTALSQGFPVLLISFILFYPASGAFVSLSQAALMDTDTARHEQNMARWTLAGSLCVVAGPIALGAAVALGLGWRALLRREVLRWLTLLECSDLLLDVLLGFLALYFVDVVGATPAQAGAAVAVWTGVGLLGNLLLIPLLERVRGLRYLRLSTVVELVLFPAFLLAPGFWAKLVLLGLMGLFNTGWYSILKAQLYSVMPGQASQRVSDYWPIR